MFPSPSASPAPSPPAYLFLNQQQQHGGGGAGGNSSSGGGSSSFGPIGGAGANGNGGGGGGGSSGRDGQGSPASVHIGIGGNGGGGYARFGAIGGGSPAGWGMRGGGGMGHQQNPSLSSLPGSIGHSSSGGIGSGGGGSGGGGGTGGSGSNGAAPSSPANYGNASHHQSSMHGPHGMSHLASPSPMHSHLHGNNSHGANVNGGSQQSQSQQPQQQSAAASNSPHWQQQLKQAEISRQSSSPHHHARAAALAARSATNAAITITDPTKLPSMAANGLHLDSQPHSIGPAGKKHLNGAASDDKDDAASQSGTGKESGAAKDEAEQSWTKIDMGGLGLKTLAAEVFRYTFLTSLFINHNSITSLSPDIVKLRNLTVLDASGNKLARVPPELGMLTGLKELYLFDNNLVHLPPEMGTLHQLDIIGIEGNPIADNLRSIIQREGTQALISFLRDTCPVPLPPSEREWITIEPDLPAVEEKEGEAPTESLNVLCYNVLCDKLASAQLYGYTPSWALSWEYRKEFILQEVMSYSADIVCLQEVDVEQFEEYFSPHLGEQDYEGIYYPKSRVRTMSDSERKRVDGCAIFFKATKFQLIEKQLVEYSQTCLQRPDFRKSDDVYNRLMTKDQIATIALLENKNSGSRLIVANTHLHWDPSFRDVKLVQSAMLIDELEKVAARFATFPAKLNVAEGYPAAPKYSDGTKIPLLICGDFNSTPGSGVDQLYSSGSVDAKHEDFMGHVYGDFTTEGVKHPFTLKSAYSNIGELPFTNYTPGYVGVLDWIWYSANTLAITGLLGEVDKQYLSKAVGFPNAHFPSDHICLLAELRIKHPSQSAGPVARAVDFGPSSRDTRDRRRH